MSEEAKSARTAPCPSCGAPLRFRGATSVVAVCAFCRSTLVREGARLENIGKQAELLEDASPIRIGTDGRHKGAGFTVVGRIQYRYGAGVWNEWHILAGERTSAWLSDASGEYTITYLRPPEPVPEFAALAPGTAVSLAKGTYTVTNLEAAEVVAGEGELPFRFDGGWGAQVVDLRGDGNRFATIDYSEGKPLIYVGESLPFEAFAFSGLRDMDRIGFTTGRALAFKCAGCGAPVESHLTTSAVVACGSCGTVTDVAKGVGEVVQKNALNLKAAAPTIPLGSTGTWKSIAYEVVGFLRRGTHESDGTRYFWSEYLLHNNQQGYAWITQYDGHFSFVKAAAEKPKPGNPMGARPTMHYLGRKFKHFQNAVATVSVLAGEFYWRVQQGDEAKIDDYVAPPLILSRETTANEVSWSLGEYASGAEIWKAFKLKGQPPAPVGIAANQPSPHTGSTSRYWKLMGILLLVGVLAQFAFMGLNRYSSPAVKVPFQVEPGNVSRVVSPVFNIGGVLPSEITLRISSNAETSWVQLSLQLTEADTGKAYGINAQVGAWKVAGIPDGNPDHVGEMSGVEPGRYTLAVNAKAGAASGKDRVGAITGAVEVVKADSDWGNFWTLMIFLLLWPIAATWRSMAYETRRWAESDYAATSTDDDSSGSSEDD